MAKTYKNLYSQVVAEIERRVGKDVVGTDSRFAVQPGGEGGSGDARGLSKIIATTNTDLSVLIAPRIINGLNATATNPPSKIVNISAGSGTSFGRQWTLPYNVIVQIPLDTKTTVFYVFIYGDVVYIDRTHDNNRCEICKIIVPNPGVTNAIVDDKPLDGYDAWIVSAKDVLYDEDQEFDDNTKEKLRDMFMEINADVLHGKLVLSENLTIVNTQGSLFLDSTSISILSADKKVLAKFNKSGTFFYNSLGIEMAKFTSSEARIGNIRITPNTIQSGNYVQNVSGFRIRDDGDAEFNNIRLRGTLYTTTIAENIYIMPGVSFIGDMNFNDDIALLAGKKLIFDRDLEADTYWVYNSATQYLEGWVDGTKRIEL